MELKVGVIRLDHRTGLFVVWTGSKWIRPELLLPDEFDDLIHGRPR